MLKIILELVDDNVIFAPLGFQTPYAMGVGTDINEAIKAQKLAWVYSKNIAASAFMIYKSLIMKYL